MKPLTIQQRKFVDALFTTTPPMNGSEAARAVGVSVKSCRVQAAKWLAKSNILAAVEERRAEIEKALEKKADITKESWVKKMQSFYYSDIRKMFDEFGNPIELPKLGDHEAAMIEGFEFCEDYTKVKKSDGSTDAVPTGYTKKYKLTSKLKAMVEFGKVMGWCESEEDAIGNRPAVVLQVNFVNGAQKEPVIVGSTGAVSPRVRFVNGNGQR